MSAGKWVVHKSLISVYWTAYQSGRAFPTLRIFRTHAEALAYAIEQAEAGQ